jgi:hypothetical protein
MIDMTREGELMVGQTEEDRAAWWWLYLFYGADAAPARMMRIYGKKRLVLSVCSETHAADFAVVTLTAGEVAHIRKLSEAVNSLGVYKIVEFDYSCDLKELSDDVELDDGKDPLNEDPVRTECDCLNVTSTAFFWSGFYKNTDALWETDCIEISALDTMETIDQRSGDL